MEVPFSAPLAISYRVLPELRQVVAAWEIRALLAAAGVLAAYVLLRLRVSSRKAAPGSSTPASSWGAAALRLTFGCIAAATLWVAVDLFRGEDFLAELWAVLPPQHENAVKGLLLVGCGWVGWSVALSESFRLLAGVGRQRQAS